MEVKVRLINKIDYKTDKSEKTTLPHLFINEKQYDQPSLIGIVSLFLPLGVRLI